MTTHVDEPGPEVPVRSQEEQERILKAAAEAKTTIIVVAAFAIGSMVFMVLIVFVLIALDTL